MTAPLPCPQCGATLSRAGVTCADRFAVLLALDHSHREPWGSRHGLAFAAYTLQHPAAVTAERLPEAPQYSVTLADLGEFEAYRYAADLDRWCRAVLTSWETVST